MPTTLRALLFDFYDTLAYVDPTVVRAGRRHLAALAGVDPELLAALWTETRDRRMLGTLATLEEQLAFMLARLHVPAPGDLLARLAAVERATWLAAVHLYPDARSALESLRGRGFRLGLLSNCSCQAGEVVRHLGLDRLFDDLTLSCEVGLMKPDPAIYRLALGRLAVEPGEVLFVADGAFGELDAARALGIRAVRIVQPRQSDAYGSSESWDFEIGSLAEVVPLADRLAAPRASA